jgi:hypothetical protein
MNTRRTFIAGAGALAAMATTANAEDKHAASIYLHGMVWNQQLAAPQNDWLIRLDAKVDMPLGNGATPVTGFATLGDDFHDTVGSHASFDNAMLQGNQLIISGRITESKNPALIGQNVRIEGKVAGTEVQNLTVTIGSSTFSGAGLLVVIAIIAILIA